MHALWIEKISDIPRDRLIMVLDKNKEYHFVKAFKADEWCDQKGLFALHDSDIHGWTEIPGEQFDEIMMNLMDQAYLRGLNVRNRLEGLRAIFENAIKAGGL